MSGKIQSDDLDYSRQLQGKFEFYLLTLVFTILGLAIQTADFGASKIADILELLAWISLLASGLAGILRLEWLPVIYKAHSNMIRAENEHGRLG